MRARLPLLVLAWLLLSPAVALPASAPTWRVDPPYCTVNFAATHILGKVPGQFKRFGGTIAFDPAALKDSRLDIWIEVASLDTGDGRRNTELLGPGFLDAGRYPQIRFRSADIRHLGGDEYAAAGELTIKDVTRRVELPFTFHGIRPSPTIKGVTVGGFTSRLTLDRLEYHVGTGKARGAAMAGRDVDIAIYLELLRQK